MLKTETGKYGHQSTSYADAERYVLDTVGVVHKIFFGYIGYIVLLFLITRLSINLPFLEEVVVGGFILVPKILSNIIGKPLLNNMIKYISINNRDISVKMNQPYPSLLFMFSMDSKAPIEFKPIELTAYVYFQSAFMGKIHWNKNEKRESENNVELVNLAIARHFESDEVPNLKAKSVSRVKLNFTPPLDIYKPKNIHKWTVETYITFSTKLGDCSKFFSLTYKFKKKQIEEVREKFSLG